MRNFLALRRIHSIQAMIPLLFLAACLSTFLLAGCAGFRSAAPTSTPTSIPATAAPTKAPLPSPTVVRTYDNPIYKADFPDPFVLRVGDLYYAYSTNSGGKNVPVVKISSDFSKVEKLGDALPTLPEWAAVNRSLTWAPAVLPVGGRYVLYYTTRFALSGKQCISRAVSDDPAGPFVDDSKRPFVCQLELGGSIDPSPVASPDGAAYLLWKNDGNCCGLPVGIWEQKLSEDGLSVEGDPKELILKDQAWEDPLIEGPAMVAHDGKYYLFYSGNWWESPNYAVGYAVCDSPSGPCIKPQNKPWFTEKDPVAGPGGSEFFYDAKGQLWMAYHAWTEGVVGYPGGARSLRIEPVNFQGDTPVTHGPTDDPQPVP